MRHVRNRSFRLLAAGLAAGSLVLAGCGGDDADGSEAPAAEPGASNSHTEGEPDTWPLTGETVDKGDSAEQKHPVLVLKMDNTSSSDPQVGLSSADLVVEELVEGGMTRLAAFYYSDIPGDVGPVRSMRASDIGIVSPVGGSIVTSGAASVTLERIRDAGIDYYSEGSPGFFRDDSRSAPYNLFTDMGAVAKNAAHPKTRPDDYLPWGTEDDLPKGRPAHPPLGDVLGRSHDQLGLPGRRLRQREQLRRGRRRVPRRHRARAARPGRRRGLHRSRG